MQYKAKYRGKNKKLNYKVIKTYENLRAEIKKVYPNSPEDCIIYYFEDNLDYDVESQGDFDMMVDKPQKISLYVRHQEEEVCFGADLSMVQSTIIHRSNDATISNILEFQDDKSKNEDKCIQEVEKPQVEIEKIEMKYQQRQIITDTGIQPVEPVEYILDKNPFGKKEAEKQKQIEVTVPQPPKEIVEPQPEPIRINQYIHKGVKCSICRSQDIKGYLWKCLNCPDYDLCNQCYTQAKHKTGKQHKNKKHEFIQIEDGSFTNRINFTHPIRKLFNPEYQMNENDDVIGQWINEDDISTCSINFVKEVWRCSAPAAKKVMEGFEQWQKINGIA